MARRRSVEILEDSGFHASNERRQERRVCARARGARAAKGGEMAGERGAAE